MSKAAPRDEAAVRAHAKSLKPLDGPGDATKVDEMWRMRLQKEAQLQAEARYAWNETDELPRVRETPVYFRVPRKGEPVQFWGLRSRPKLNGVRAEVLDGINSGGLVDVRVAGGKRKLRVHPSRLRPATSASSPVLPTLSPSPWSRPSTTPAGSSCLTVAAPESFLGVEELQAIRRYLSLPGSVAAEDKLDMAMPP
jgi:hypothetical protein